MAKRGSGPEASLYVEFFKIYLPDQSSQQLRVPPAFVKHFNGTIPNKAILKDLSGKFWHVDMEKAESGVSFKNGWHRFASDHSLELGNFLVFRYNGTSLFDVKIFGKSGCMKDEALANKYINEETLTVEKTAIPVKVEEESEEEQTCPKPTRNCNRTRNCKRKYSEIGMKRSEKSKGIASKTIKQLRAFDASDFAVPTNPYFIASVSPATPSLLHISRQLLVENGIKMEPEMVFHDQNGKSWPMKVSFRKDGRIFFSKVWMDFWKENSLGLDDKCILEFVFRGGRRLSREIQVQILRARERKLPRYTRRQL